MALKLTSIIGVLCLVVATAMADRQYVFEADYRTDALSSDYYTSQTNLLTWSEGKYRRGPLKGEIAVHYRVFVTQAQYEAGWAALDPAIKAAAKAAAEADMADSDVNATRDVRLLEGTIEMLREEINLLRSKVNPPLPPYGEADWKGKAKDKTPKPKKE